MLLLTLLLLLQASRLLWLLLLITRWSASQRPFPVSVLLLLIV